MNYWNDTVLAFIRCKQQVHNEAGRYTAQAEARMALFSTFVSMCVYREGVWREKEQDFKSQIMQNSYANH